MDTQEWEQRSHGDKVKQIFSTVVTKKEKVARLLGQNRKGSERFNYLEKMLPF